MGRPRKYASAAEKQAAYRQRWVVRSLRLEAETDETIKRIADEFDASPNEVINSLIKFALTNRNWHTQGLWGKRLTTVADIREAERIARAKGAA